MGLDLVLSIVIVLDEPSSEDLYGVNFLWGSPHLLTGDEVGDLPNDRFDRGDDLRRRIVKFRFSASLCHALLPLRLAASARSEP